MATTLEVFLRKLRLANDEILKDMAKNLGVSSAFLSAVENGKKKMPNNWERKLKEVYSLSTVQIEELRRAVMESSGVVELNLKGLSTSNRELAISFARQFETMDDETSKELLAFLQRKKTTKDGD